MQHMQLSMVQKYAYAEDKIQHKSTKQITHEALIYESYPIKTIIIENTEFY